MPKESMSVQKARELSQEEKEQLFRTIEQYAYDAEVIYWGCSQAVLDALQRHLNLGNGETFKAASAFAGGVARTREVCGALLGGIMVIGLAYGRTKFEAGKVGLEQSDYLEAQVRASRLCERFKEKFTSLRCDDVRRLVREPDFKEYTRYNTLESFEDHSKCGNVTGPAARLAAEIILLPKEVFATEINAQLEDLAQLRKLQKGEAETESQSPGQ